MGLDGRFRRVCVRIRKEFEMKKRILFFLSVAFLLILSAGPALATQFLLGGTNYSDISASVDFSYNPLSSTSGEITIVAKNTSSITSALTGFAFNVPSNISGLSAFSGPTGWSGLFKVDAINTPMQYGFFDIAGITGPNFNGGKVGPGLDAGQTGIFTMDVTGTSMDTLTAADFLGTLSELGDKVGLPQFFVDRFQGIGDFGGSDVATPVAPPPVPEPGTVMLFGLGLFGLAVFGKRKMNRET